MEKKKISCDSKLFLLEQLWERRKKLSENKDTNISYVLCGGKKKNNKAKPLKMLSYPKFFIATATEAATDKIYRDKGKVSGEFK